ncbi:MAG TPA: hypothetical protein PLB05_11955, partial [Candidatus Omnitrophota bacterium]|nr:hypothetical protein [Candidatus Omnitrophota bacterium]
YVLPWTGIVLVVSHAFKTAHLPPALGRKHEVWWRDYHDSPGVGAPCQSRVVGYIDQINERE